MQDQAAGVMGSAGIDAKVLHFDAEMPHISHAGRRTDGCVV